MKQRPSYPWLVTIMLAVVAMLNYIDRQMISTMRPAMQVDIQELMLAANFGRLMAVFLWVYGSISAFSGIIADRINRKWLIVASLFIWSTLTLLNGFALTFEQLYILRALMGFSEALYFPAALSLIADYHDHRTRSRAVGIHATGIYLGQVFGGFGATISKAYSWQNTFLLFGVIGMLYAVVLIFFVHEKEREKNETDFSLGTHLKSLFTSLPFWIILLYFTIPSLPGWAIKNWAPTLIASSLHLDMAVAGPLTTISISLSSFFGVLIGGALADKWYQSNPKGRMYTSAIGLALTIPSLILLGFGAGFLHIITAAVFFGLGFGMFDTNNMPILCQFVDKNQRATGYGFLNMGGIFAGAIITDFLGKSTDAGNLGRDLAYLSSVVLLIIVVQLTFLKPKKF
ncbi:MAG: MFS transporter [Bacteroidota bacterium]